jgi:putative transcriptional regulator
MFKGKLLVSSKITLEDINFNRSVVLIVDHKHSGSLGFIMNKKLEHSLKDFTDKIKIDVPVFLGGPLDQDNLFFIHDKKDLIPNSLKVNKNLFWGGDMGIAIGLLNDNKLNNNNICFFLGCSGWTSGQLDNEIKNELWLIEENKFDSKIIKVEKKTMWRNYMISFGGEHLIWANSPESPGLN